MDLSSNRPPDADKVMQRQLYRPGQTQPTARSQAEGGNEKSAGVPVRNVATKGKASTNDSSLKLKRLRKKALIALGVMAWLLLLGGISYCLFLPDLEALNRERSAIWEDKSLTFEQKREKFEQLREKERNLTPTQRKQMWEMGRKEWTRKGNVSMNEFLDKMTPAQQAAHMKKRAEEWEKMRKRWEQRRQQAARNGGGNRGGGGQGGGNRGGGGQGGGGRGGGGERPATSGIENGSSPESRAGRVYQRGLMQQQMSASGGKR